MTKTKIIFLVIASVFLIGFAVTVGLIVHHYNFPTWTNDVKEMAVSYLRTNEEILENHGDDALFEIERMTYNTKTRDSVVYIRVDSISYAVTIDCVENEFIIRGHEKTENDE